jgi:glycosyltransferase involved in cell wall biosynthesis/SAM-dependent methyltransferase
MHVRIERSARLSEPGRTGDNCSAKGPGVKILQVVHAFPPTHVAGTEIYTHTLSRALLSRGHRVRIFTREGEAYGPALVEADTFYDGIPVRRIHVNRHRPETAFVHAFLLTVSDPAIDRSFDLLLHEFAPDIVHFQHTYRLSASMIAIAQNHRLPILFTLHDYWMMCHRIQLITPDFQICDGPGAGAKCAVCLHHSVDVNGPDESAIRFRTRLAGMYRARSMRRMLLKADLLISPSEFLRRKFIEFGVPPDRIIFLDNGLNIERFGGLPKRQSTRLRFGFVSTNIVHKGLHVLVEAFNKLPVGKAELFIYGDPAVSPAYYESVRRLASHPDIAFIGFFENQKVAEVMSGIDVLVVPSIWPENSPLAIHEAFLAGVPVIASRIGGIPELVRHGQTGLLFETGNPADLRAKMEHLIDNPSLIVDYARNAGRVKSIQENAAELEQIYERLMRKRAVRRGSGVSTHCCATGVSDCRSEDGRSSRFDTQSDAASVQSGAYPDLQHGGGGSGPQGGSTTALEGSEACDRYATELEQVAAHWGEQARVSMDVKKAVGWLASPLVERCYIHPRISGNPEENWLMYVKRRFLPETVARGLTIGCGDGGLERHGAVLKLCLHYDAFDISPEAIAMAKETAERHELNNVRYEVRDLNHISLERDRYDVVFSSMALHHVERLEHLLAEVHQSLKADGLLVLNEYVGPDRFQWTPLQLMITNGLLQLLPPRLRRNLRNGEIKTRACRPSVEEMKDADPSEAVRSSAIVPLTEHYFRIIERIDYGGTILHLLFQDIMGNFDQDRRSDLILFRLVCGVERWLIRSRVLSSDFTLIVAKKRQS